MEDAASDGLELVIKLLDLAALKSDLVKFSISPKNEFVSGFGTSLLMLDALHRIAETGKALAEVSVIDVGKARDFVCRFRATPIAVIKTQAEKIWKWCKKRGQPQ